MIVEELSGHHGWVTDVSFAPDGNKVVTACSDGTSKVSVGTIQQFLLLTQIGA